MKLRLVEGGIHHTGDKNWIPIHKSCLSTSYIQLQIQQIKNGKEKWIPVKVVREND
jgi:hypothetical protein